ncbi:hypothetical protein SH139x_003852 [Planctomycetaceae bacterium SH139]
MATVKQKKSTRQVAESQWPELRRRIIRRGVRRNLATLWPEAPGDGGPLVWGWQVAAGEIPPVARQLGRLVAGKPLAEEFDLLAAVDHFLNIVAAQASQPLVMAEALQWAYALPKLAELDFEGELDREGLTSTQWWRLLDELQLLQRAGAEESAPESLARLMSGGELGLVLAWQLADLPSCEALQTSALEAVSSWFEQSGDAVAATVGDGGRWIRLGLASALRSRRLSARFRKRISLKRSAAAVDLATWTAAMTRANGSNLLGPNVAPKDDCRKAGLFDMAIKEVGGPALKTAIDTSLHRIKSDGRLAWRVELPEPGWFDGDAGLAVMLPEWDVRRGRVAVDFSQPIIRLEVSGGKQPLLSGQWRAEIIVDGVQREPSGPWRELCWHSDDDVHYLEVEQTFAGGIRLQRQVMLLRDDRALMLADAVLGAEPGKELQLLTEVDLAPQVAVDEDDDMRELLLVDDKRRAMVLPLALGEWRVGKSRGNLSVADQTASASLPFQLNGAANGDSISNGEAEQATAPAGLLLAAQLRGQQSLYHPLWLDLLGKRLRSSRTWRRLTVGEKLSLVPEHQATAFRVHCGNDQWVVYRSLTGAANRTFLGKNLISDFFCGRFDADDGSVEELISVDEHPE